MQVHPDMARLRSSDAPQPSCDAALTAWRTLPQVSAARTALAQYDAGAALGDVPDLARLTHELAAARAFAAGLITPLMAALRAEPLAHLPLGHSAAPGMARLRVIECGRSAVTLTALATRAHRVSPSALFEDGSVHELVVAGAGTAMLHCINGGALVSEPLTLAPGAMMTRTGHDTARQITAITRPLLLLQVTRAAVQPGPSRELATADGRLIQTISGCKRTSQQIMALGVLGALQHPAGIGAMDALARDPARQRDLRWEALRQVLGMDAVRGLALLTAMAGDVADPLSAPAKALRQQLLSTHPDCAALMQEPV
jgi:hypothetical protein